MPRSAGAISSLTRRDRAAARRARRTPRRRRAGRPPRRCRSKRRPARSRGRRHRRRAAPRPRPSAGRGCPRRGGRAPCDARAGSRPSSSRPGLAHRRQPSRPAARRKRAARPRRTRSLSASRGRRTRPATCRRPGPGTARAAAPPRAPRARARGSQHDAGQIGSRPARRSSRETPARAGGVHRHFSSRWLRQKARSNAGSPYQAHSASRNTGPVGPDQDVLRADVAMHQRALGRGRAPRQPPQRRRQVRMRAARSPAGRARGGCRGRSASVGKPRATSAVPAVRGVDRGQALARPRARRRIGLAVAQRCLPQPVAAPGRDSAMTSAPAAASSTSSSGTAAGHDARGRRASRPPRSALRSTGARQSASTRSLRQRALDADRARAQVDPPDVRGHAAGQRLGRSGRWSISRRPARRSTARMSCGTPTGPPAGRPVSSGRARP